MSPQVITRRSALRAAALSLAAAIAGFVVARTSHAARSKGVSTAANGYGYGAAPTSGGRLLARVDQVPVTGGLILTGEKIVLTAGQNGAIHGFSAVCTHQGCTVGSVSRTAIVCPCHGSTFSPQTGAVISGPATQPLPVIAVVVRDNNVYTN
jgi:Rieske Fe-S protein